MMHKLLIAVAMLAFGATQSITADNAPPARFISEATVKLASAMAYSTLVEQARRKGWQYRESDIESGLKHYHAELRLRLIDEGYTILPPEAEPTQ
jgi:hypothetical protein